MVGSMTRCAAPECSHPNAVAYVSVADFEICSACWLTWTRGGSPNALCASLRASDVRRAPDKQARAKNAIKGNVARKAKHG